ncbi:MAG: hypothetical protein Q4D61_09125 [Cardiobacteriaceae bacterium]|nr:hypothetical protein [Cardiobacteriaceae bacterium]
MKTLRKRSAFVALLALAACTARTETLPGQQTKTLADYLPAEATILEVRAAPHVFLTTAPYYAPRVPTAPHIEVTDAALRAETLKRLRAVRVAPVDGEVPRALCTEGGNPFGVWMLGNGTMLVDWTPVSDMQSAKNDEFTRACLQIGDESHWFEMSDADLWQALKSVWQEK